MLVFIGNLPGNSPLIELQHFLGNHEMSVDYSTHRHEKAGSHFLLIKTNSFESSDDLIRDLNGKTFNNVKIEARKFIQRNKKQQKWAKEERRTSQLELNFT